MKPLDLLAAAVRGEAVDTPFGPLRVRPVAAARLVTIIADTDDLLAVRLNDLDLQVESMDENSNAVLATDRFRWHIDAGDGTYNGSGIACLLCEVVGCTREPIVFAVSIGAVCDRHIDEPPRQAQLLHHLHTGDSWRNFRFTHLQSVDDRIADRVGRLVEAGVLPADPPVEQAGRTTTTIVVVYQYEDIAGVIDGARAAGEQVELWSGPASQEDPAGDNPAYEFILTGGSESVISEAEGLTSPEMDVLGDLDIGVPGLAEAVRPAEAAGLRIQLNGRTATWEWISADSLDD